MKFTEQPYFLPSVLFRLSMFPELTDFTSPNQKYLAGAAGSGVG
jgi:hypothetical protein